VTAGQLDIVGSASWPHLRARGGTAGRGAGQNTARAGQNTARADPTAAADSRSHKRAGQSLFLAVQAKMTAHMPKDLQLRIFRELNKIRCEEKFGCTCPISRPDLLAECPTCKAYGCMSCDDDYFHHACPSCLKWSCSWTHCSGCGHMTCDWCHMGWECSKCCEPFCSDCYQYRCDICSEAVCIMCGEASRQCPSCNLEVCSTCSCECPL
jgi:hypothetical protein